MHRPILINILILFISCKTFAQFPTEIYAGAILKGKIDSVIMPQPDGGKILYIFNRKKQLIEETNYSFMRNPDFGTIYRDTVKKFFQYDVNGHLSTGEMYLHKRNSTWRYRYVYTDSGYVITTVSSNPNFLGYDEMKFSRAGNLIQKRSYPPSPDMDIDYKYNKQGQLVQQSYVYDKRHPSITYSYTYDTAGNLLSTTLNRRDGPVFNYTYTKFDEKQNWLIRNTYQDGTFLHKIERGITYHK